LPSGASGGINTGRAVGHITFEDISLVAGSQLGNCIINASDASEAAGIIQFNRAAVMGNGSTQAGIFMARANYWEIKVRVLRVLSTTSTQGVPNWGPHQFRWLQDGERGWNGHNAGARPCRCSRRREVVEDLRVSMVMSCT
jgi:hypothetical protein